MAWMPPEVTMLPSHPLLAAASVAGRRFLGCELAFLGGAMTWVSER
jgi:hypothetical protein